MKKVLQKLGLNPNNSIVIGSGILQALGIRKSKDMDIVATQEIYNSLKKSGKFTISENHGRETLADNLFEIGTSWNVLGKSYSFKDFDNDSIVIDGVRFITLDFLYKAKRSWVEGGVCTQERYQRRKIN
jgi:hypothetical protein